MDVDLVLPGQEGLDRGLDPDPDQDQDQDPHFLAKDDQMVEEGEMVEEMNADVTQDAREIMNIAAVVPIVEAIMNIVEVSIWVLKHHLYGRKNPSNNS